MGLKELKIQSPGASDDVTMKDLADENKKWSNRKRQPFGEGISAGPDSPFKKTLLATSGEQDTRGKLMFDSHVQKKTLWTPQDARISRSNFDPSNIASVQAQRSRAQAPFNKARSSIPSSHTATPAIFVRSTHDIMLQPETRPISQEKLVAEVKGIYAGLVMVEAKCFGVDSKPTASAQPDTQSGDPQRLNNEQWQALIALHRSLLHEYHGFFLASQHPSASPALKKLAAKYATPARMWRHSFLELSRHHLLSSVDHHLGPTYQRFPYSSNLCVRCLARDKVSTQHDNWEHSSRTWSESPMDKHRYRTTKGPFDAYTTWFNDFVSTWAVEATKWFRKHKQFLSVRGVIPLMLFPRVAAAPVDRDIPDQGGHPSSGFTDYWEYQYQRFMQQYSGPLLMNTAWGVFLSTLYFTITYCDQGRWKGTDLLLISITMVSGGSFFLGMSEWLSGWQLSLLWIFNACLDIEFLQQKLSEFPRSRELIAFGIGLLGFVSAGILAVSIPAPDGRYKNPWIHAAMLVPPTTIFISISWIVLLRNTGVARALEDGNYHISLSGLLKNIALGVIALILLLALLGKN